MGDRLAGSPAGWLWCLGVALLAWAGPRARLLPYVACKRVLPDSLHPGFAGEGRGCPWSFAGCDPDAHAGSPRPVSYGALGQAAAAPPLALAEDCGLSPLAMTGSQAVPVVMTVWSWRSRLPATATATRAWVGVSLLSARPVRCVSGGEHGVVPQRRPHRPPGRQPELGP